MGIKRGCRGGAVEGVLQFHREGGPGSRGERKGRKERRRERERNRAGPRGKEKKKKERTGFLSGFDFKSQNDVVSFKSDIFLKNTFCKIDN